MTTHLDGSEAFSDQVTDMLGHAGPPALRVRCRLDPVYQLLHTVMKNGGTHQGHCKPGRQESCLVLFKAN